MMTFSIPNDWKITPGHIAYDDLSVQDVEKIERWVIVVKKGIEKGYTSQEQQVALEWLKMIARMHFLPVKSEELSPLADSLTQMCGEIRTTREKEAKQGIFFQMRRDTMIQRKKRQSIAMIEMVGEVCGPKNGLFLRCCTGTITPEVAELAMNFFSMLFPKICRVSSERISTMWEANLPEYSVVLGTSEEETKLPRVLFRMKKVVEDARAHMQELDKEIEAFRQLVCEEVTH